MSEIPHLLLLPGWGHSARVFEPLVDALGDRAVCRGLDMPGHGTRRDEAGSFSLARLVADTEDELARMPLGARYVLGWSLGSLVALELAASAATHAPDGLVLVAGTACFLKRLDYDAGQEGEVLSRLRKWVSRDPARAVQRFRGWMDAPAIPDEEPPETRPLDQTLGLLARTDLRDRLNDVQVPVLLLHGEADRVVPPASSEALARALPQAEHHVVGKGHAPFLEDPELCARLIADWLAARRGQHV